MSGPVFFVDRSLGRVRLPRLLRADDWSLVTMSEHYGEETGQGVSDTDWLQLAGENGWPVLAKDEKIRYRPAERAAISAYGVRAFYLTSGNLTAEQMADAYIANRPAIWERAVEEGPGLFAVTRASIREIDLTD
jgi:hypothetical protein